MSEVPDEVQAAMSLKLMENVRNLIREEVSEALRDPLFLNHLYIIPLAERLAYPLMQNPTFAGSLDGALNNTVPRIVLRSDVANAITIEVAKRLAVTPEGIYVTTKQDTFSSGPYLRSSSSTAIGPFTTTFLDNRVVGVTLSNTGNK